jgi:hypothetical protein
VAAAMSAARATSTGSSSSAVTPAIRRRLLRGATPGAELLELRDLWYAGIVLYLIV